MNEPDAIVPPPAVSPDAYDDEYYRTMCAGYEEWTSSDGHEVAGIYPGILARAAFQPGETVVDIGTGRGELVAVAAAQGATLAIGVDYSEAAVELARHTLKTHNVEDRAEVRLADARHLPLDDEVADLVTMVDVVEHLTPEELDRTLTEARRVLRPGGRVFAHTMPNRLVYDITYRAHRLAMRLRGYHWPRDPRNEYEHEMHVNEQTRRSLRRTLVAAGFDPVVVEHGSWIHTTFLPDQRHGRLYRRLAAHRITRALGSADLFATAVRPAAVTPPDQAMTRRVGA